MMKISFQILLLAGVCVTVMIVHRSRPENSRSGESLLDSGSAQAIQLSRAPEPATENIVPKQQISLSKDLTRAEVWTSNLLKGPIFNFLKSTDQKEQDFLMNEVGLSKEDYREVRAHQQEVYAQLKETESWARAFGVDPEVAKKPILQKHVLWMQRKIGVGYYAQLQEISLSQLPF